MDYLACSEKEKAFLSEGLFIQHNKMAGTIMGM
jgi:hypothetical protein